PEEQREALELLSPEQREEVLQALPPEERLAGLPPEQRLAGLSAEQIEQVRQYLDRLTAGRPGAPRKPRREAKLKTCGPGSRAPLWHGLPTVPPSARPQVSRRG